MEIIMTILSDQYGATMTQQPDSNRQMVLNERPTRDITDDTFAMVTGAVPVPGEGEVLLRTVWLAFDPAQRGWINDIRSYVPPVAIGEVMRASGIGEVVVSNVDGVEVGQLVHAMVGWQDYTVVNPATESFEMIPADIADPTLTLGVLGTTGLTAYFGMLDIGRPVQGDTVLVTAAAGATGSVAGQIARIKGAARVIGTAGAEDKRAWVRDVAGFDDCVDHYDEKVRRKLYDAGPTGYQVVFDNVGGTLLDAAIFNIANHARIVLCGSISTGYRPEKPEIGLHFYQLLTTRSARMEGFLVTNYRDQFAAARAELAGWVADGSLRHELDVLEGLENAPDGLRRLFAGKNLGKQALRVT
jgi:NADPH-dependent curcumin reductase CurA